VDVIDVERGLQIWRDASKFRAQLKRFVELHGGDARLIEQALDAADAASARRIAHKLAGAAEVVALTRLARQARSLERDTREPPELREHVGLLSAALQLSERIIEQHCTSEQPGPLDGSVQTQLTGEPANDNQRRRRASQLMAALDSDDPSVIEPLLPIVPSLLPPPQAEKFLARVRAYDFRGAEAILLAETG
jgi:HPt (histidine-containing phosphotransfer) domain-containing protein